MAGPVGRHWLGDGRASQPLMSQRHAPPRHRQRCSAKPRVAHWRSTPLASGETRGHVSLSSLPMACGRGQQTEAPVKHSSRRHPRAPAPSTTTPPFSGVGHLVHRLLPELVLARFAVVVPRPDQLRDDAEWMGAAGHVPAWRGRACAHAGGGVLSLAGVINPQGVQEAACVAERGGCSSRPLTCTLDSHQLEPAQPAWRPDCPGSGRGCTPCTHDQKMDIRPCNTGASPPPPPPPPHTKKTPTHSTQMAHNARSHLYGGQPCANNPIPPHPCQWLSSLLQVSRAAASSQGSIQRPSCPHSMPAAATSDRFSALACSIAFARHTAAAHACRCKPPCTRSFARKAAGAACATAAASAAPGFMISSLVGRYSCRG